ncbi:MAG: Ig-like domain repeat protein [Planctomycetaceae bacterium]|nr:Ig-like domain repeat protein [Planctomycetaceae bacterium]
MACSDTDTALRCWDAATRRLAYDGTLSLPGKVLEAVGNWVLAGESKAQIWPSERAPLDTDKTVGELGRQLQLATMRLSDDSLFVAAQDFDGTSEHRLRIWDLPIVTGALGDPVERLDDLLSQQHTSFGSVEDRVGVLIALSQPSGAAVLRTVSDTTVRTETHHLPASSVITTVDTPDGPRVFLAGVSGWQQFDLPGLLAFDSHGGQLSHFHASLGTHDSLPWKLSAAVTSSGRFDLIFVDEDKVYWPRPSSVFGDLYGYVVDPLARDAAWGESLLTLRRNPRGFECVVLEENHTTLTGTINTQEATLDLLAQSVTPFELTRALTSPVEHHRHLVISGSASLSAPASGQPMVKLLLGEQRIDLDSLSNGQGQMAAHAVLITADYEIEGPVLLRVQISGGSFKIEIEPAVYRIEPVNLDETSSSTDVDIAYVLNDGTPVGLDLVGSSLRQSHASGFVRLSLVDNKLELRIVDSKQLPLSICMDDRVVRPFPSQPVSVPQLVHRLLLGSRLRHSQECLVPLSNVDPGGVWSPDSLRISAVLDSDGPWLLSPVIFDEHYWIQRQSFLTTDPPGDVDELRTENLLLLHVAKIRPLVALSNVSGTSRVLLNDLTIAATLESTTVHGIAVRRSRQQQTSLYEILPRPVKTAPTDVSSVVASSSNRGVSTRDPRQYQSVMASSWKLAPQGALYRPAMRDRVSQILPETTQFKSFSVLDANRPTAPPVSPLSESLMVSDQTAFHNMPSNWRVADINSMPELLGAPNLDAASDTGVSNTNNYTADNTPTFSGNLGKSEAGGTVTLFADGTSVGTETVEDDGSYSVTSSLLVDGSYAMTITVTDEEGKESLASSALPVVIDTVEDEPIQGWGMFRPSAIHVHVAPDKPGAILHHRLQSSDPVEGGEISQRLGPSLSFALRDPIQLKPPEGAALELINASSTAVSGLEHVERLDLEWKETLGILEKQVNDDAEIKIEQLNLEGIDPEDSDTWPLVADIQLGFETTGIHRFLQWPVRINETLLEINENQPRLPVYDARLVAAAFAALDDSVHHFETEPSLGRKPKGFDVTNDHGRPYLLAHDDDLLRVWELANHGTFVELNSADSPWFARFASFKQQSVVLANNNGTSDGMFLLDPVDPDPVNPYDDLPVIAEFPDPIAPQQLGAGILPAITLIDGTALSPIDYYWGTINDSIRLWKRIDDTVNTVIDLDIDISDGQIRSVDVATEVIEAGNGDDAQRGLIVAAITDSSEDNLWIWRINLDDGPITPDDPIRNNAVDADSLAIANVTGAASTVTASLEGNLRWQKIDGGEVLAEWGLTHGVDKISITEGHGRVLLLTSGPNTSEANPDSHLKKATVSDLTTQRRLRELEGDANTYGLAEFLPLQAGLSLAAVDHTGSIQAWNLLLSGIRPGEMFIASKVDVLEPESVDIYVQGQTEVLSVNFEPWLIQSSRTNIAEQFATKLSEILEAVPIDGDHFVWRFLIPESSDSNTIDLQWEKTGRVRIL